MTEPLIRISSLLELPTGEELEQLLGRAVAAIRDTKDIHEVCVRTKMSTEVLRELRKVNVDFQEYFDMAFIGRVVPRFRVGQPADEVDIRIRTLKSDGKPRKAAVELVPEMWEELADEMRKTGSYSAAARRVGCTSGQVRMHRERFPELQAMLDEAREDYVEGLREAARQRAVHGTLRPMLGGKDRDRVVAHEVVYSDKLLEMELKRQDPAYRDHKVVEQTGSVSIKHSMDLSVLSPKARSLLRAFLLQVREDRQSAQAVLTGQTIEVKALPAPTAGDSELLGSLDAEEADLVEAVEKMTRGH